MKSMTFAVALATATATALSGAAYAEGMKDRGAQSQYGTQTESMQQSGQNTGQNSGMDASMAASGGQQAGMSGDSLSNQEIRDLQQALNDAGQDIAVDGIWGPNTSQAVASFQAQQGIQASGELNRETLASLGVDINADRPRTQQAQTPEGDMPGQGMQNQGVQDPGMRNQGAGGTTTD